MKFVKFKVHTINFISYDKEKEMYIEELKLQCEKYINIRRIKSFRIWWYEGVTRVMILNNDWKIDRYNMPRYIPADKDQFKEAFGLDWDEL